MAGVQVLVGRWQTDGGRMAQDGEAWATLRCAAFTLFSLFTLFTILIHYTKLVLFIHLRLPV